MNGPTGQWILKIILPGLRIQSEILTDLRILNLQRFVVSSIFGSGFFEFAREIMCDKCPCIIGYGDDWNFVVSLYVNNNKLFVSYNQGITLL